MLHNANVDYDVVKKNLEEALYSKLLNMGQNSGKCEMHAAGFVHLTEALKIVNEAISKTQTAAKAKAKAETV